jgi:hypothetical protein
VENITVGLCKRQLAKRSRNRSKGTWPLKEPRKVALVPPGGVSAPEIGAVSSTLENEATLLYKEQRGEFSEWVPRKGPQCLFFTVRDC